MKRGTCRAGIPAAPERAAILATLVLTGALAPSPAFAAPDCVMPPPQFVAPYTALEVGYQSYGLALTVAPLAGPADVLVGADADAEPGVTVLQPDGAGCFQCVTHIACGDVTAIATARMDTDAYNDLVVTAEGNVRVVRWVGEFLAPASYPAGSGAAALVIARLNADVRPDVVVGTAAGVAVLFNDGAGGLLAPVTYAAGGAVDLLALGDVTGDHLSDLVAGSSSRTSVTILRSLGNGTYANGGTVATGPTTALRLADLDGDGALDLVTADGPAGLVRIAWGDGAGGFASGTAFAAGGGPRDLVTGDFDADGRRDVAVAIPGAVAVLRNAGARTLDPPAPHESGEPYRLVAADLDDDALPDFVTLDSASPRSISLVAGRLPAASLRLATSPGPRRVFLHDLDADGRTDLVVSGTGGIDVFPGNDAGLPGPRVTSPPVGSGRSVFADVNGDGRPDLVMLRAAAATVNEVLAVSLAGVGLTFGPAVTSGFGAFAGYSKWDLAVGHVDGDGLADALVASTVYDHGVLVLHGNGDGTFGAPFSLNVGPATAVAVVDFDADGDGDIVYGSPVAYGAVAGLRNDAGTFTPAGSFPVSATPAQIEVADLDADGRPDLAVQAPVAEDLHHAYTTQRVCVALANGTGWFAGPQCAKGGSGSLATGDVDGDGLGDLAVTSWHSSTVSVLHVTGGVPGPRTRYGAGPWPDGVAIGDVDRDGYADVVVVTDAGVSVLSGAYDLLAVPAPPAAPDVALRVAPNPARAITAVTWTQPRAAAVSVRVLDVQGRTVRTLAEGAFAAGAHRAAWSAGAVRPGVYFVTVRGAGRDATRRVVVLGR